MLRKTGGIVVLVVLMGLSVFLLSCGSSNSRPAGVLFVTSQGASVVQSYAINLGNGDLSQLNTTAPTGSAPSTILLDPTRTVAYVLNTGDSTITTYTVNSNGSLGKSGSTSLPSSAAVAMARDAAGKFLFVVTTAPQLVVFGIQPGSTNLTPVGTPLTLTRIASAIEAITATITNPPAQPFQQTILYVTSIKDLIAHNDNTLSEYAVDASGNVTEQTAGGSPLTTGTNPAAVLPVVTPAGNLFAFVDYSNSSGAGSISSFQVCTSVTSGCSSADVQNLKITPTSQAPTSVGLLPLQMITDATSNFLYVANSGSSTVSSFRINPTTGGLSAISPQTVSTGSTPVALTLHPNGEFIYVSNSGSASGTGSVSGFSVNINSGSLSGGLQINSAAQPAGLVAK